MRIEIVQPRLPITVTCLGCGKSAQVGEGKPPVYADLDGPSFKAYYHEGCRPDGQYAIGIKFKGGWRFLRTPFSGTFTEFEKNILWFTSEIYANNTRAGFDERAKVLTRDEVAAILKERTESYEEDQT